MLCIRPKGQETLMEQSYSLIKRFKYSLLLAGYIFLTSCSGSSQEDINKPVFSGNSQLHIEENSLIVTSVYASSSSGDTIIYDINGGVDQSLFSINSVTGVITFNNAPDYEAPDDDNQDNIYQIDISASDSNNTRTVSFSITIINLNDNSPVFTSASSISIPEGTNSVMNAVASDADSDNLSYSITGGADQGLFSISNNGALSFLNPPVYNSNGNNVYSVEVSASDGSNSVSQTIVITVTSSNTPPVITSAANVSIAENTVAALTVTATDTDSVTFSISGGTDQTRFSINSTTGALTFINPPDFESPVDANNDNIYLLQVTANDGRDNSLPQNISISITNINDIAPVFTSSSSASIAENTSTSILTVNANDAEGDTVSYSITGGVDQNLFSINSNTGALSFNSSADFETPLDNDSNNSYQLQISASDTVNITNQSVTITVTNVNDIAPVFTSSSSASIAENTSTSILTVNANDAEGDTVSYSITGGVDQNLFSINSGTGALSFNSSPDFETPLDNDSNNSYQLQVSASDTVNSTNQSITVTVTNVNDNSPVFTTANAITMIEGNTAVSTINATDVDGDTISYSLTGGVDAGFFSINSSTGALSFNTAPAFNTPLDNDANNIYNVQVTASDSINLTNQQIAITVADATNLPPTINSASSVSINENTSNIITVSATDNEGDTITYSITGGDDQALFSINSSSGALTFNSAPDYETPLDSNTNNTYLVQIGASDAINTSNQLITVSVNNTNDNSPVFTSSATPSFTENSTSIISITATDADNDTITFSITGGIDQALFSINTNNGQLSFNSAPDYENPTDNDANNTYLVQITASDSANTTNQSMTISVNNANDNAPVFSSSATASITENSTSIMTINANDADGNTVTYSISGGIDQALFSINSNTGALVFNSAADFETPLDSGADNSYQVQVSASDTVNTTSQSITVNVTNLNDNTPVFSSSATVSIAENITSIMTINANDADGNTVTYSISGGIDQALFSINTGSGQLSFNSAPDFENPTDNDTNNTYIVQITASDSVNTVNQSITVSISNANDIAPVFTSSTSVSVDENITVSILSVNANDAEGDTVSYSISGGNDQNLFSINSSSGDLSFNSAPDYENPLDSDTNNSYLLQVSASDTVNTTSQAITITVNNLNDNTPSFTSASTVNVIEGNTSVITVNASDADGNTVTYSISGGVDQNQFTINSTSGALTFNSAPVFATPADSDSNNIYIVQITASDGTNSSNQTISVTVLQATAFNGIILTRVFSSLTFNAPVLLLQHPTDTDRWYVVEKHGRIQTFLTNSATATEFADITSSVSTDPADPYDERGLLGMAFHPNFASNNYIYVYYSTNAISSTEAHDSVVVRYTASSDTSLNTSSGVEIINIAQPFANHNGGNIMFGSDGYLYIGMGDGGGSGDPYNNAQDTTSLLGKMLRIDVDSGTPYSSPNDNPYVGISGRDEIYALGLRNPWRWSFDRTTGDLIAGDVGQNLWEEIDIIVNGGNFGWRCYEGAHTYDTSAGCSDSYIQPIFEYDHDTSVMPGGYSITGGYIYRGSNIPALNGSYIFTDYITGTIWGLASPYGTPVFSELSSGSTGLNISSFAEDANGEVYAIHMGGTIWRIDPAP